MGSVIQTECLQVSVEVLATIETAVAQHQDALQQLIATKAHQYAQAIAAD
jgi:hypothetical protein